MGEKEIFIGFSNGFGKVDVESLKEYVETHDVEKIYIFVRKEPLEKIKKECIEAVKVDIEFNVTLNPVKEAKRLKKSLKGKKVVVQDLEDFGKRALRDVC